MRALFCVTQLVPFTFKMGCPIDPRRVYLQLFQSKSATHSQIMFPQPKEYVAVLTMLYKKNGAVTGVGFRLHHGVQDSSGHP